MISAGFGTLSPAIGDGFAASGAPEANCASAAAPRPDGLVHQTVAHRLVGAHEEVPFGILLDLAQRLTRVVRQYPVEHRLEPQYLLGVDLDIGGGALGAAPRLVDHDPAVGQSVTLPRRARGEQHRAHRRALTDAVGLDVAREALHGVVDGKSRRDRTAGAVDVKLDVLLGVLGLQEQQLRHDQIGDVVVDRGAEQDDPVLEQPAVDIVRTLTLTGLLDHHRDQKRLLLHSLSSGKIALDGSGGLPSPPPR